MLCSISLFADQAKKWSSNFLCSIKLPIIFGIYTKGIPRHLHKIHPISPAQRPNSSKRNGVDSLCFPNPTPRICSLWLERIFALKMCCENRSQIKHEINT